MTKKSAKKTTARQASKTTAKKVARKTTAKKPTKKSASKTTAIKKVARKRTDGPLAVDGSQLDEILDLAGARKPRKSTRLATLEQLLGRPVPNELRDYMARQLDLDHPDADHPDVLDATFEGQLPHDVPAWLEQLKKPTEGTLQAIHQLAGLYPLGVKLERGDFLWVFAGLEPFSELASGGVFYFDGRELGGYYPGTISGFLLFELTAHWTAQDDGGELRDVFHFSPKTRSRPPEPVPLPDEIAAAFDRRASSLTTHYPRIAALLAFLRGQTPDLAALPSEAQWLAERATIADDHAAAMYWLLAHWLFDNGPELAEAAALTRRHRSRIVAAVREHVTSHDATAAYGPQQTALFAAVRLAAAAT